MVSNYIPFAHVRNPFFDDIADGEEILKPQHSEAINYIMQNLLFSAGHRPDDTHESSPA